MVGAVYMIKSNLSTCIELDYTPEEEILNEASHFAVKLIALLYQDDGPSSSLPVTKSISTDSISADGYLIYVTFQVTQFSKWIRQFG
ncbi:uncharacterized protein G2W53_043183 [Senna tora]|uniref:Uncharacterized protein n=1 Tax=Senna tora TaxID=362788 RepID=A0A834SIB8_9FABA|nr:uncharacterized protein G2W53_043183 [Senna tora]